MMLFTNCIIINNLKLFIMSKFHCGITIFFIYGSTLLYISNLIISDTLVEYDSYNFFSTHFVRL